MRTVREPNLALTRSGDVLRDLQEVVAALAHARNTAEDIEIVSVGGGADPDLTMLGGLVAAQVLFGGSTGSIDQDAELSWDTVAKLLTVTGPTINDETDALRILRGRVVIQNDPAGAGSPPRRANHLMLQYATTIHDRLVVTKEYPAQSVGGGDGNKPAGMLVFQTDMGTASVHQAAARFTVGATRTALASLGSTFTAVQAGDILGRYSFAGDDANGGATGAVALEAARIEAVANATASAGAVPVNVNFGALTGSMYRWHFAALGADEVTAGEAMRLTSTALDLASLYVELDEIAAPATPATNAARLFLDTATGNLSIKKDTGTVVDLEAAGAGVTDHGALTGLFPDDDHGHYLLLGGRAAAANDAIISTTTTGRITGSSNAASGLILAGNTVNNVGAVSVEDLLILRTVWPAASAFETAAEWAPTLAMSVDGSQSICLSLTPTGTINSNAASFLTAIDFAPTGLVLVGSHEVYGFRFRGDIEYQGIFGELSLFLADPDLFANDGTTATPPNVHVFDANPLCRLAGTNTGTTITVESFRARPRLEAQDTASWSVTNCTGFTFQASLTEAAGATLSAGIRGFNVEAPIVSGGAFLSTTVGYRIANVTQGTTNLSFQSLGAAVQMRHAGPGVFGANAAPTAGSVALEVQSTVLAFLASRMTTAQETALTAVDGMILYNSTLATHRARRGGAWLDFPAITVRKNSAADVGHRRRLNFIEGSNVTLTVADDGASEEVDVTIAASGGGGGSGNFGTAMVDFGAFPGKSDASVAVTGQAAIVAGSVVNAWLRPVDSADHTADEHLVETIRVEAGNIVAGTGFTVYAMNSSDVNEPLEWADPQHRHRAHGTSLLNQGKGHGGPYRGGTGTRIYGVWNVQWQWG